jgi:hypothetical protein
MKYTFAFPLAAFLIRLTTALTASVGVVFQADIDADGNRIDRLDVIGFDADAKNKIGQTKEVYVRSAKTRLTPNDL